MSLSDTKITIHDITTLYDLRDKTTDRLDHLFSWYNTTTYDQPIGPLHFNSSLSGIQLSRTAQMNMADTLMNMHNDNRDYKGLSHLLYGVSTLSSIYDILFNRKNHNIKPVGKKAFAYDCNKLTLVNILKRAGGTFG